MLLNQRCWTRTSYLGRRTERRQQHSEAGKNTKPGQVETLAAQTCASSLFHGSKHLCLEGDHTGNITTFKLQNTTQGFEPLHLPVLEPGIKHAVTFLSSSVEASAVFRRAVGGV